MHLSPTSKKWILVFLLIASIVGFMLRLPSIFHRYDKELHFAFYFGAIIVLSGLLAKNQLTKHIYLLFTLLFFGIAIEFFQEMSNHLVDRPIHGRFDKEDVQYNATGLLAGSLIWNLGRIIKKLL